MKVIAAVNLILAASVLLLTGNVVDARPDGSSTNDVASSTPSTPSPSVSVLANLTAELGVGIAGQNLLELLAELGVFGCPCPCPSGSGSGQASGGISSANLLKYLTNIGIGQKGQTLLEVLLNLGLLSGNQCGSQCVSSGSGGSGMGSGGWSNGGSGSYPGSCPQGPATVRVSA